MVSVRSEIFLPFFIGLVFYFKGENVQFTLEVLGCSI